MSNALISYACFSDWGEARILLNNSSVRANICGGAVKAALYQYNRGG